MDSYFCLNEQATYFDSFGVAYIPKQIKKVNRHLKYRNTYL